MLISEAIAKIKAFSGGCDVLGGGKPIDPIKTRDQVLYGSVNQELTGIVSCIWPSTEIVREAQRLGANLIISHEAIFWNHGDRQGWLAFNKTFQAKKEVLDEWGGAVWRNHDFIHSQVPIDDDDAMVDGIFYGLAWKLGWLDYRVGNKAMPMDFEIPETSAKELAADLVHKLGLRGTRLIGDPDARVRRVHIPMHLIGPDDDRETRYVDEHDVDCLLCMETTDFTTCECIRDAAQLGQGKAAITIGHFNVEEPGMEYLPHWVGRALGTDEVPCTFVAQGDPFHYILA